MRVELAARLGIRRMFEASNIKEAINLDRH